MLVGGRWGKAFATFFVVGIIVVVASAVVGAISGPFGIAGPVVSGVLSALYQPLFPILLVVFYYSNLARTAQPTAGPIPSTPATAAQAGMKFCPSCGTHMASSATFCANCGAKQPA